MITPLMFKLAWKELKFHKALAFSFMINLSLGLVGFITIEAFKASMANSLDGRSRAIMGADMVMSARRPLSVEELAKAKAVLPEGSLSREERSFFTMAWSGKSSRLVEIRAVDEGFPYYGALTLERSGQVIGGHHRGLHDTAKAWLYPELSIQLGLELGDQLRLGQGSFEVSDLILKDPSVSNMGFSPAPKVCISLQHLEATGLLGFGSRQEHRWLVKLPQQHDPKQVIKDIRQKLNSSDIVLKTHDEASQQISRLLSFISDYLGLVSLVALFLSALGTAYLFQSFVETRQKSMATLSAMGYPFKPMVIMTLIQLFILGSSACALSLLTSSLLLPALPKLLGDLMVDDIELGLDFGTVVLAWVTAVGGAILFSLPSFHRLRATNTPELFRETSSNPGPEGKIWAWLPSVVVFWCLGLQQTQSLKIASLFVALFVGAVLACLLLAQLLFRCLRPVAPSLKPWPFKLALLNLVRRPREARTCFLAIAMAAFLLILIPQISRVLGEELDPIDAEQRPSLFCFDIQPHQLNEFKAFCSANEILLQSISPLVSARLLELKGQSIHLDTSKFGREAEMANRLRNRTLNLSSREHLSTSETLIAGQDFSGAYDPIRTKVVEASLETRYADRLNLSLGDHFKVDILGLEIEAKVINTRKVRWSSFQPNFFILFQPGVLEDAPRTYLASLLKQPIDHAQLARLQQNIVAAFPNVGVVDVRSTLDRLLSIVEQIMTAIQVTALFSILASFAVLYSICRQQRQSRRRDLGMITLLGSRPKQLVFITLVEFSLMGCFAGVCGMGCGVLASYVLSSVLFDGAWFFDAPLTSAAIGALVFFTTLTGVVASGPVHAHREL